MIIVMKADTQPDSPELARVIAMAESYPGITTQVHRIQGATRSVDLTIRDPKQLDLIKVGDQVQAVTTQTLAMSLEPQ